MKKILLVLAAMMVAAVTQLQAQSTLVATLSHGDSISAYYGANALKEAYAAAASGDVITLSSGQFNAVNIEKSVTIRGTGIVNDSIGNLRATYINGDYYLRAGNITLEGLYHKNEVYYDMGKQTIPNLKCYKCRFASISGSASTNLKNAVFVNCRFASSFSLTSGSTADIINCVIASCNSWYSSPYVKNSVIYGYATTGSFENCIFIDLSSTNKLSNNAFAISCMAVPADGSTINTNFFSSMPDKITNKVYKTNEMFESFSKTYDDYTTYKFKESEKGKFKGNDGTEIGLYGGLCPYTTVTSNPKITKFEVAPHSTPDGKLNIDITVAIPE